MTQHAAYYVLKHAVSDGLKFVAAQVAANRFIGRYHEFPELGYHTSGLPAFSKVRSIFGNSPLDYTTAFFPSTGIERPQLPESWSDFQRFAASDPKLASYYQFPPDPQQTSAGGFSEFIVAYTLAQLVNRYVHVFYTFEFREAAFTQLFNEWANAVYSEHLHIDIVVPILMTAFDFESVDVSEGLSIEVINDTLQLARSHHHHSYTASTNESVVGAATHALVLRNWQIENTGTVLQDAGLSSLETYARPLDLVNIFFASLRAVTGLETGYGQIIAVQQQWATSWTANLPPVRVVSLRGYPDRFENYYWNNAPAVVSAEQCQEVGEVYDGIQRSKSNKLFLAARRLNSTALRTDEEDSILDVTIGLESLLTDDSQNEVTYRLSMRLGALGHLDSFEGYTPGQVFKLCKRVYDYRSAVVHGNHKATKKRVVRVAENREIPAVTLGRDLLRYALRLLSQHHEYLDVGKIDDLLLSQLDDSQEDSGTSGNVEEDITHTATEDN